MSTGRRRLATLVLAGVAAGSVFGGCGVGDGKGGPDDALATYMSFGLQADLSFHIRQEAVPTSERWSGGLYEATVDGADRFGGTMAVRVIEAGGDSWVNTADTWRPGPDPNAEDFSRDLWRVTWGAGLRLVETIRDESGDATYRFRGARPARSVPPGHAIDAIDGPLAIDLLLRADGVPLRADVVTTGPWHAEYTFVFTDWGLEADIRPPPED